MSAGTPPSGLVNVVHQLGSLLGLGILATVFAVSLTASTGMLARTLILVVVLIIRVLLAADA